MLGFRNDIGYQFLLARPVFTNHYDDAFDTRVARQSGFDLAQFDAEASNLYLVVATSEELDISIGKVACHIAGAIHPGVSYHRTKGLGTNRSAVRSGCFRYPAVTPSPAM